MPHPNPARHMATTARHFIFCTGIENSYPIVRTPDGRQLRRDGMALSRHYDHWREDFQLVKDLGINFLRYGPPYYKTHLGPMRYDWGFADKVGRGLGVTALFSGPPGTGKTMVAGLVARDLGLELYQVDTGKLVSKWLGETEKHLALQQDIRRQQFQQRLRDQGIAIVPVNM